MRILILNQYGPDQEAPTGGLFGELRRDWENGGHTVDFICAGRSYRSRSGIRWLRELGALCEIGRGGMTARKSDLVVVGSSPPCALAVAALVAEWHGAALVHWAMDLYPELGTALRETSVKWLSGILRWVMKRAYARCQKTLTLDEDMAEVMAGYGVTAELIRPWVCGVDTQLSFKSHAQEKEGLEGRKSRSFRWVYSGNLGRAHEWRTLLEAQALLEEKGVAAELVFQGGGFGWESAQKHARELGLKRCVWLPYVAKEQLLESLMGSDCLVATQLPETRGYLWPSKLALFLGLPRPVLWVGPVDGAIGRLVGKKEGTGCFSVGDAAGVVQWLEKRMELGNWVLPLWDLAVERRERLADWRRVLERGNGGQL